MAINNHTSSLPKHWQISFFLVAMGIFLFAPTAKAQVAVLNCIPSSGAMPTGQCASEATAAAQYTYLSTGHNTTLAGAIGGAAGIDDGIIQLLRNVNNALGKANSGQQQGLPNDDAARRQSETDIHERDAIERLTRPITAAACNEASVGGGLGGGGGGGGAGAATKDAAGKIDAAAQADVLAPRSENEYAADLVTNPTAKNYCTAQDAANKLPQCLKTGVGSLPGADTNPTVLREGARAPGLIRNYSILWNNSSDQYNAIIDYVRLARPFPGPTLAVGAKDSPEGKKYLIYQRRYNSRVMAVIYGFTQIAAMSAALPPSSFVDNVWKGKTDASGASMEDDFHDVYGKDAVFPAAPSEREIMHLMVLRQYATFLSSQDMHSTDPVYFAQRQLELAKLNAYLLLKINDQQEMNGIVLDHILSNAIDPVTRDGLVNMSGSIQSSGKAAGK